MKYFLFLVLLITFFSCSTTKGTIPFQIEKFKSDEDAIIYLYRISELYGSAITFEITIIGINKNYKTKINMNGYHILHTTSRKHIVEQRDIFFGSTLILADNNVLTLKLTVQPQTCYYIKITGSKMELVDEEIGLTDLKQMKKEIFPWEEEYATSVEEW